MHLTKVPLDVLNIFSNEKQNKYHYIFVVVSYIYLYALISCTSNCCYLPSDSKYSQNVFIKKNSIFLT